MMEFYVCRQVSKKKELEGDENNADLATQGNL